MSGRHAEACAATRWDGPCVCPEGGGRDTTHGIAARWSPLLFVEAGPEAHGFVVTSFCRSYRPTALAMAALGDGADVPKRLLQRVDAGLFARVKSTLERARVVVAVSEDKPTVIVAACVYEPRPEGSHFFWLYVSHTMRTRGVGRATLEACDAHAGGTYSHHTKAGAALARRFHLSFTPEAL